MNMKKQVEARWQQSKVAIKELIDQFGVTWELIQEDFKTLSGSGKEMIGELLEEWADDQKIRAMFDGFIKKAGEGRDAAVTYLKEKQLSLRDYLDKTVRERPRLVGGVDGFFHVYLAVPADRWVKSSRYRQGVITGRVIGILVAVISFLPASAGRVILGLLPGASHGFRYFMKQWQAAKERRSGNSAHL